MTKLKDRFSALTRRATGMQRLAAGILMLCLAAPQAPAQSGAGGSTVVDYTSEGQSFQFQIINGQVRNVVQQGQPVVIYLNGGPHPISQDAKLVAIAEEAVKAYKSGVPSGAQTSTSSSTAGLTVDGVVSLLEAGLSDDLIIAKIQANGRAFDLSTDDMIRLKKAKASDAVIKAMMNPAPGQATQPVAQATVPAYAAPAKAAPQAPQKRGMFGGKSMAGGTPTPANNAPAVPNAALDNPNLGKLPKESFFGGIGGGVKNAALGRSVIDKLGMRNILPQWDPNGRLDQQFPHIAITVLDAPSGWTDDFHDLVRKDNHSVLPRCFKLKAIIWFDATRSKPTDEFQWCLEKDAFMNELQPVYLMSMNRAQADFDQTTGINRTDGPEPPDDLLPNDRATLDMWAKTTRSGSGKDLNNDQFSLFAFMFANVRKDLGETLGADGDYRVWVTSIKKAAGPPLF